jgi:hypothetical protein
MQQASLSNKHHSTFELRRLSNRRVHLSLQKKQNLEQRKTQYQNHNFVASYLNMGFACIDVNTEHGGDQLRVKERKGGISCGAPGDGGRWQCRPSSLESLPTAPSRNGRARDAARQKCIRRRGGRDQKAAPIFDGGLVATLNH